MSRYKVLLLSPLLQGSGNTSTVHRLRGHLEEEGYVCQVESPSAYVSHEKQGHSNPDLVIGIHAFKSGAILKELSTPYIVILGGTDVNEFTSNPEAMEIMTACITKARHVVSFSETLAKRFHQHWPDYRAVSIIPQGVQVFPSRFDIRAFLRQADCQNTLPPPFSCDRGHNTEKIFRTPGDNGHINQSSQNLDKPKDLGISHGRGRSHDHSKSHENGRSHDNSKSNENCQSHDHSKSHDHSRSHDHVYCHDNHSSHECSRSHDHCKSHDHGQPQDHSKSHDLGLSQDHVNSHDKHSEGLFHQIYDTGEDPKLFTIAGGIRRVKNPLYLSQAFSDWRTQTRRENCFLLIVGHKMENDYFSHFQEKIKGLPGILYVPGLDQHDMHAAIQDSFVLVNSSDSEGMAVTILEAMLLRTLVLVRGIPGNMAVVRDGETGMTFDTLEEFIEKAEKLLEDPDQVSTITQRAHDYVTTVHSLQEEKSAYLQLTKNILSNPPVMKH